MIVCKRCGYKNQDEDADFCASCGRFLEWSGEKVEAPVEAPAPVAAEEPEEGRRGLIERVEGWVRGPDDQPAGAAPAPAAAGDPAPAAQAAGPVLPAPAAPAAAPVTPAGPAMPAAEAAPVGVAEGAPVFGPAIPTATGEEPSHEATTIGPAVPAASASEDGPADGDLAAEEAPAAAAEGVAPPLRPADPTLAAFIARPVELVPAIEPDTPKEIFKPDLGQREGGPDLREAAPERQPGMPAEKQVFRPAQFDKEVIGPSRVVRDGDIVCPRCGQGNYPWRNYCRRCGLVLDHGKAGAERHGLGSWIWSGLSHPVHRKRRKLVRAGERPGRHLRSSPKARSTGRKFQAPQLNKKRLGRVFAALAVVVLAFGAFGPFKKGFHDTTSRWWHDLQSTVDINYVAVYPVAVTASTSSSGNGPENANDNNLSTFWASYAVGPPGPIKQSTTTCKNVTTTTTTSTTTTVKGATTTTVKGSTTTTTTPKTTTTRVCTTTSKLVPNPKLKKYKPITGVGQWLLLDFSQPENIGGFAMFTGAQDSTSDFTNYERPKEIELIFSSAPPLRYSVSLAKTLQSWKFIHPATTFLKIVILSVYPANTGSVTSKQEVAITDVFPYSRT